MSNIKRATLNIKSARRYPDGLIGSQVIIVDEDGSRIYYACRMLRLSDTVAELERDNVRAFINGKWQSTVISDATAALLSKSMLPLTTQYYRLFNRELLSKQKPRTGQKQPHYGMWNDTIISVATPRSPRGHCIKIGARIFETASVDKLVANSYETSISYRIIGDTTATTHQLNITENSAILERLTKQMEVAEDKYFRAKSSQPIGFDSWDDLSEHRHQSGQYAMSPKQHRKFKASFAEGHL